MKNDTAIQKYDRKNVMMSFYVQLPDAHQVSEGLYLYFMRHWFQDYLQDDFRRSKLQKLSTNPSPMLYYDFANNHFYDSKEK